MVVDGLEFDTRSFAPNYFFYSTSECGNRLELGRSFADDLSLTRLEVSKTYKYCSEAIASNYMASDVSVYTPNRVSSLPTCELISIAWEASIKGLVTSKASTGSIPIQGVSISWTLMDPTNSSRLMKCKDAQSICSGSYTTDTSGSFEAEFWVNEPQYQMTINDPVPVLLTFSRSFGNRSDIFLANNELTDITANGTVVFLKHLQFDTPLYIVDASMVAFSGKVYFYNTAYGAIEGCPVTPATVCAFQTQPPSGTSKQLACVDTDSTGVFHLPLPVGSLVHNVTVDYFNHEIIAAPENTWASQYSDGVRIDSSISYLGNNFVDKTISPVKVDVVGGLCNRTLGTVTVTVKLMSCPDWPGKSYQQKASSGIQYVPASIVSLMVSDIKDSFGAILTGIKAYFADKTVTLDTRKITPTSSLLSTSTTDDDPSLQATVDTVSVINDQVLQYARFQYDGDLKLSLSVLTDATGSPIDEIGSSCRHTNPSKHVIHQFTQFFFDVHIFYQILPTVACDIVEDGMSIDILSNLAYEDSADFLSKLSSDEVNNIQQCSTVSPCSSTISYVNGTDAGLYNFSLWTGRPTIFSPYTKQLIIQANGHKSDGSIVQATMTYQFVITGSYTISEFGSIALPTHTPVLILRDPPGGLSTASYTDVVTAFQLQVKHDEVKMFAKFTS